MSSAEENLALARRFLEAQVKGDLDTMDEMMSPDFVGHTKLLPDQQPDRECKKWAYAQFSAAVSNPSIHFEDHIAGGEQGGDPLHRARHPRSRGAHGRRS